MARQQVERLEWVDTAKGVGIVVVVAGHIVSSLAVVVAIYLWHMPLFFLLSGYLFAPREPAGYLRQKARHLLVPYLSFLLLLSIVPVLQGDLKHVARMLFGGRVLHGWFGVFWFVPVLFVTQQLANRLIPRLSTRRFALLSVACLLLAWLIPPASTVPYALDVVLVALPLFWIGWLCRGMAPDRLWLSLLGAVGIGLCALGWMPTIVMKNARYGWPVVTLLFAIAGAHLCAQASRWLAPVQRPFQALGRASMTILYLHPVVFIVLRDDLKLLSHQALLVAVATLVPFALHHAFAQSALTRRLFLGEQVPARPAHRVGEPA